MRERRSFAQSSRLVNPADSWQERSVRARAGSIVHSTRTARSARQAGLRGTEIALPVTKRSAPEPAAAPCEYLHAECAAVIVVTLEGRLIGYRADVPWFKRAATNHEMTLPC